MMKQEFEQLAGYEVSWEDYTSIIEPMYMATELSKQDFVKTISKKRFALPSKKQMLAGMRKEAQHIKETCGHYYDEEARERLDKQIAAYIKRFYFDIAGYYFNNGYTYEHLGESRGCSYPRELIIYGEKNYNTFETIQLV